VWQAWTALVKNRRKNGDHYWVRANVAPVVRQGQVTGYISVRTKPPRDEVAQAEALYRQFREGQATGVAFHKGLVVRKGWLGWTSWLQTASVATRVRMAMWPLVPLAVWAASMAGLQDMALGGFGLAVAVMVAGMCVWLQAQVTTPLRMVAKQACAVATGQFDANVRLNRVDEIGMILRAINQSGLNVRSLVADVGQQVDGLQNVATEIAAASDDLGSRTEHTASNLAEASSSVEQLTSSVARNADTAVQASTQAGSAAQAAAAGGHMVSQMEQTMTQITESSRRIGDIIGVIDGIAFQTNILALNAAVEAARAGEQGRGFAVVAGEVRSLAQRSATAAHEIKDLIGDSMGKVQAGATQVRDSRRSMDELVRQVQDVAEMLNNISVATREQSGGIDTVNTTVGELDQMTQQNAAMVEQSAAAAHSMHTQANKLVDAIGVFKV
jgi:aerotaxis receptor